MIGLYTRVSSKDQEQGYSLSIQRKEGVRFANSIPEEYSIYEEAKSAKDITSREEFQRLLRDIEAGTISSLWVIDNDRLSRKAVDSLQLMDKCVDYNVKVYVGDKHYDFKNDDDIFRFQIECIFADRERRQIKKRASRGVKEYKDSGSYIFPKLFGYRIKYNEDGSHRIEIVEEEVKTIRYIYELFSKGYNFKRITRELDERLIPTKTGKKWTTSTLCSIMKKPIYTGHYYNNNGELIKSKYYKPIITLEQFVTAQKYWHNVKKVFHSDYQFHYTKHQSSSIIKCGECNTPYVHAINKRWRQKNSKVVVYRYYQGKEHKKGCSQKYKLNLLNVQYIDNLFSCLYFITFSNYTEASELLKRREKEKLSTKEIISEDIERYNRKLEELNKRKEKIANIVLKSQFFEVKDFDKQMGEIKAKEEEIRKKLERAEREFKLADAKFNILLEEFTKDSILSYIIGNPGQKRSILLRVIKSAAIEEKTITTQFITGRKYVVDYDVPKPSRWVRPDPLFRIKVIDEFGKTIKGYILHAKTGDFSLADSSRKINLKYWIEETKKAVEENKPFTDLDGYFSYDTYTDELIEEISGYTDEEKESIIKDEGNEKLYRKRKKS